jgi:hypothetical protein
MNATSVLLRLYRPVVLWFAGALVAAELIAGAVIAASGRATFSLWLIMAGSAVKYWLLVVGVMLVTTHLRQFVANGATRREFLTGAAMFGLTMAVLTALMVPLGHGVENAVLGLTGDRSTGYPPFSAAVALAEFGRVLPGGLAYLISGGLFAAGFYRFAGWIGVALLIPAALPLVVAQTLLGVDGSGVTGDLLPYAAAVVLSLLVTGVAAAGLHRAMRDVAIRRTAG